jgi:pyruvate kinase
MRRNRRVKIIATLGPASTSPEVIKGLFDAGADVFRINMSHASQDDLRVRYNAIRKIEEEARRPIGILCDLQGPKLRVGKFAERAVQLVGGARFTFDTSDAPGDLNRVRLPHPEIFKGIQKGHHLLLNDGKLRLVVTAHSSDRIETEVLIGGELSDRKGVSLPDTDLPFSALTDIDRSNLLAAADVGVDWVALSFVQRAADVIEARDLLKKRALIMAKIEKPSAVEDIENILNEADAIMVARGDLGVELPLQDVPGVQKRMTRLARRFGKPVVVATQMLESMIEAPVPTRAEVSDVATAVYDGADAIMLSAESASGKYPIEAVATMNTIAAGVERDEVYDQIVHRQRPEADKTDADAISAAACSIARDVGLKAIVCYTSSGATALRISRHRPSQPILVLATSIVTARRLALAWGVHCVKEEDPTSVAKMVTQACRQAVKEGMAEIGDKIIVTAGLPFGTEGATNTLRVVSIDASAVRSFMKSGNGETGKN